MTSSRSVAVLIAASQDEDVLALEHTRREEVEVDALGTRARLVGLLDASQARNGGIDVEASSQSSSAESASMRHSPVCSSSSKASPSRPRTCSSSRPVAARRRPPRTSGPPARDAPTTRPPARQSARAGLPAGRRGRARPRRARGRARRSRRTRRRPRRTRRRRTGAPGSRPRRSGSPAPRGRGAARLCELVGGDVDADDVGAGPRGPQRHAAGAAGDVEDSGARLDRERLDNAVVDRREGLGDALVARATPDVGDGPGHAAEHTARRGRPLLRRRRPRARARSRRSRSGCGRRRSASSSASSTCSAKARRCGARSRRTASTRSIFYGPPGSGKTTLARIVAATTGAAFEELSAVSATVKDVREVLARARERLGTSGTAHDPLPRRDPPLQQGAAGCAPARRRVGAPHADRRDDREPVLRGQLRAHLANAGVRARDADPGGDGGRRPARARARSAARRRTRSSS